MSVLIKEKIKDISFWLIWLILVILWNYLFPFAEPLYDVVIAITLSFFFILINNLRKEIRVITIAGKRVVKTRHLHK